MDRHFDDALCRDFPNTFRDRKRTTATETPMCRGFECGNGWEPIIRRCSEKIEAEILKQPEESRADFKAFQVKQKLGGLRFYMVDKTPAMEAAIVEAERAARTTCEPCGARRAGLVEAYGYLMTLCTVCRNKARRAQT